MNDAYCKKSRDMMFDVANCICYYGVEFTSALRKLYFHFLSNWMGYERDDSFLLDFEPNMKVRNSV